MPILRIVVFLSLFASLIGGCSAIRGGASGAPGDAWYIRASNFSGKIKDIHYCPPVGSDCYEAKFVDTKELAVRYKEPTAGGDE
jgi:hypothetical protein